VRYYIFDVMVLAGRDVTGETLDTRRALLEQKVVPTLTEPVRYTGPLTASLRDLIHSVKAQGLEGLVAKRRASRYEPGQRSGAWQKMRVNRGQEFVIGGYTIGTKTFDAIIFGYYDGDRLLYAARTRNGFTPALRQQLFKTFRPLEIADCPFANLPEAKSGRWGQGLTKAKMADCRWLEPFSSGSSSSWSGRPTITFGTRRSSASDTTNLRVTSGASSERRDTAAASNARSVARWSSARRAAGRST
jgi:bifunctional non-homologous end joining protein LigD